MQELDTQQQQQSAAWFPAALLTTLQKRLSAGLIQSSGRNAAELQDYRQRFSCCLQAHMERATWCSERLQTRSGV